MSYPDETLKERFLSLAEFVKISSFLETEIKEEIASVRYALAGRFAEEAGEIRVFLNSTLGVEAPPLGQYTLRRDIDSMIGITRDLPFRVAFALFPLASFRDTLTKDNHLKFPRSGFDGPASLKGISLHKIPNMALGKADRRHITRIFFPFLYAAGQKNRKISTDTRTTIYNCIRSAAITANPSDQSRWPLTYEAVMHQYRDDKGQFHFGTIDHPPRLLPKFTSKLLELFDSEEELRGAFFVHELRGTKGACHHDPTNAQERQRAVSDVMYLFDRSIIREDEWVVDVALEIRQPERMLQWWTLGHSRLLNFLLPSATSAQVTSVLHSSTQYHLDLSSQLKDVGGFRSQPGSRGAGDKVLYINAYTTDKSVTYQLHNGVFKRRKPWHLFPKNIKKLLKDLQIVRQTFLDCSKYKFESSARVEARIPLSNVLHVLNDMPDSVVKSTLLSFDPEVFWGFKYHRMTALYRVIEDLQHSSMHQRMRADSLMLGGVVAYQISGLIFRPAEGRVESSLLEAACQHVFSNNSGDEPIMYNRGTYFLSDIVHDGSYTLPMARILENKCLCILYRRGLMEDIISEFLTPVSSTNNNLEEIQLQGSLEEASPLVPRKRRRVLLPILDLSSSESSESSKNESEASDAVPHSDTDNIIPSNNADAIEMAITEIDGLSDILKRFATEILPLAPRRQSQSLAPPWLLLNSDEVRERGKIGTFKSLNFTTFISRAQCIILYEEDWKKFVFARYFPPLTFKPKCPPAHFSRANYYQQWNAILNGVDSDEAAEAIRALILPWFQQIIWLPYPGSDRMWAVRRWEEAGDWFTLPTMLENDWSSPRIAVNGSSCSLESLKDLIGT